MIGLTALSYWMDEIMTMYGNIPKNTHERVVWTDIATTSIKWTYKQVFTLSLQIRTRETIKWDVKDRDVIENNAWTRNQRTMWVTAMWIDECAMFCVSAKKCDNWDKNTKLIKRDNPAEGYQSAVACHLAANADCCRSYRESDFTVLSRRSKQHRDVLEAMYIRFFNQFYVGRNHLL